MEVYIHSDAHIASIALTLSQLTFPDNPIGDLSSKQLADIFKRENIRSYNFAHNKRSKLTPCATIGAIGLTLAELINATANLEEQSRARDDYEKSEASKIIEGMYRFLPTLFTAYNPCSLSGITVADALKSFAHQDDGSGMSAWHWDDDWKQFEKSEAVRPGRIKPYPWLIRQLLGDKAPKFPYEEAKVADPLAITKYLIECITPPADETAQKIYNILLRYHVLNIPEVKAVHPVIILSDDEESEDDY